MRQIASFLPAPILKQSKVNRVWRFFHKMKIPKISCYKAFAKIIHKKTKTDFVILDFTSIESYDVKVLIASFPFKGRSIPFYAKVLKNEDLKSLKYKSQNDFLFKCIDEILSILPFKPIIIADRGFGFYNFLRYLQEKRVGYVIRLNEEVSFIQNGKRVILKELNRGKYSGYLKGKDLYIKVAVREGKKGLVIIGYSPEMVNRNTLHMGLIYLKRMQCEEMHRELKSRLNLLGLNKRYYKEPYDEEILERYLMIGIFLGKVFIERYKEFHKYVISDKKELSYFGIGMILILCELSFTCKIIKSFILSLKRG